MRRLGFWARENPFKIVLMFLAFTAEQGLAGVGGFFTYFGLMFSAIVLGLVYVRGGRH